MKATSPVEAILQQSSGLSRLYKNRRKRCQSWFCNETQRHLFMGEVPPTQLLPSACTPVTRVILGNTAYPHLQPTSSLPSEKQPLLEPCEPAILIKLRTQNYWKKKETTPWICSTCKFTISITVSFVEIKLLFCFFSKDMLCYVGSQFLGYSHNAAGFDLRLSLKFWLWRQNGVISLTPTTVEGKAHF